MGRIAWHIAASIPEFLSHFGVALEIPKDSVPTSAREIADGFRKISTDALAAVQQQWTDEFLKNVQNAFGMDLSNAAIVALLIKHAIHHRGQMTVLMRQAGLKVPGVYGPAKEGWSQMGVPVPPL